MRHSMPQNIGVTLLENQHDFVWELNSCSKSFGQKPKELKRQH